MDTNNIIGFLSGEMFLLIILLIGVLYLKLHWVLKSLMTISSLCIVGILYVYLMSTVGYPLESIPQGKLKLLWAETREPNLSLKDDGAIYIWYYLDDKRVPRASQIPYSKNVQEMMEEAKNRIQNGIPVYMESKKESDGKGDGKGDGSVSGKSPSENSMAGSATALGGNAVAGSGSKGGSDGDFKPLDFIAPPATNPRK